MKRSAANIAVVLFALYLYSWSAAAIWFNVQSARTNGVGQWLRFGEVVSTVKAVGWPYYAYRDVAQHISAPNVDPYLDVSPRADTIRRVVLAATTAADLLASHPLTNVDSLVVARRLQALVGIPASASPTTLAWVYPGWSRAIHDNLVPAMRGFITLARQHRDHFALRHARPRAANVSAHVAAYQLWNQVNRLPLLQALEDCAILGQQAHAVGSAALP